VQSDPTIRERFWIDGAAQVDGITENTYRLAEYGVVDEGVKSSL
jgi:hypothetical protein